MQMARGHELPTHAQVDEQLIAGLTARPMRLTIGVHQTRCWRRGSAA
jgi:hypothetical protein